MDVRLNPRISDDYNPKAENAQTINNGRNIGGIIYIIFYQVLSPIIIGIFTLMVMFHYSNLYSHYDDVDEDSIKSTKKRGKRLRRNTQIFVAISFSFSLYVWILDILALVYSFEELDPAYNEWYNTNGTVSSLLIGLPIIYFIMDTVILLLFLTVFTGLCKGVGEHEKNWGSSVSPTKSWFLVIFPIMNVTTHADQIVIGFMNNAFHASAISIMYGLAIVISISSLKIVSEICLNFSLPAISCDCITSTGLYQDTIRQLNEQGVTNKEIEWYYERLRWTSFFVLMLIITLGMFAAIVGMFVVLPLNATLDQLPTNVVSMYHGIFIAFIAYISYWILLKEPTSQLDFLIHMKDNTLLQKTKNGIQWSNRDTNWAEKTKKEKEIAIAERIQSIINISSE